MPLCCRVNMFPGGAVGKVCGTSAECVTFWGEMFDGWLLRNDVEVSALARLTLKRVLVNEV